MRFHVTAKFDLEITDWAEATRLAAAFRREQPGMGMNIDATDDVPSDEHDARAVNIAVASAIASWVIAAGAMERPDVVALYDPDINVTDNDG
jgi:hypothetical protein